MVKKGLGHKFPNLITALPNLLKYLHEPYIDATVLRHFKF